MKAEWMANVGGEEYGPFTWDQMLDMAAQGRVTPELPVRKASDSQWSTAAAIPGLLGGAKPAANGKAVAAPAAAAAASKSAVKKAKVLARPAADRPAPPVVAPPQYIPSGIPVGAPVGVAVAPSPPASSPSGAFSFDLGTSPSGKYRSVKKTVLDDDDDDVTKKKSNTAVIVGVLGGVTLLVAVLVGLTIYITMNRGGQDEKLVATNTSAGKQTEPGEPGETNPGEVNPEGEADTPAKKPAGAAKTTKTSATNSPAKSAGAVNQKAIVEGIREWKNIVTLKSVGIGNARIAISRVWLAADATGKRAVVPGAETAKPAEAADPPAGEETPPAAPAAPATSGSDQAKYLFVEIAISNKAGAVIKYKGWNSAGANGAILADDQNQVFPLVPISETPGIQRKLAADVPGGGAIVETLVFAAPTGEFDALHLALPQVVFYPSMKGKYFALEMTPDVLSNEGGPPVALPPPTGVAGEEPNDPLVSGRRVPTDPATPEGPAETTKPVATVKSEPPPPKKPSLIDEINKFDEEQNKGKKMDEGKGAQPAAKTPPAKAPAPAKKTAPKKGKK